jgi:hypothetical protein
MRPRLCLFLALTICTISGAQRSASIDSRVSGTLARMESKDLAAREKAFDDMMGLISEERHQARPSGKADVLAGFFRRHPDQADRVRVALIQLLSTENDAFISGKNTTPGTHTEEDGEYYAEVIDTISSLDDERAIPALVGAMTTGGMAKQGLLRYGDKALGPVLEQLKNPDALVRAAALGMSVTLLEKRNDPTSHKHAVDIIRSNLTDSASVVRSHAVREIGCLDERQDFVPTLENIAKTDPERFPGKAQDGGDGEEFYPVRYDARRVLRDIQSNKRCAQ